MTEQGQKAVEEYAKKASQIDTLIISNSLNESIKAYNEGVHNGILMGAQFLDNLRKVSDHETNVGEAGEELVKVKSVESELIALQAFIITNLPSDIAEDYAFPDSTSRKTIRNVMRIINESNERFMKRVRHSVAIREANNKTNEYIRKDLAIEFATRFYQLMTSARVDEYIGARKDVCVNDLFEEFLKTK